MDHATKAVTPPVRHSGRRATENAAMIKTPAAGTAGVPLPGGDEVGESPTSSSRAPSINVKRGRALNVTTLQLREPVTVVSDTRSRADAGSLVSSVRGVAAHVARRRDGRGTVARRRHSWRR